MAKNRIGFGSDFVLTDQQVGIGTTFPTAKLQVVGTIKGDFNVAGVSTLGVYAGFTPQKQTIDVASTIGFSTSGVGTFIQVTESETGYLSLSGEFNTVSEDIIVDEGKIFEVSVDSTVSVGTLESISVQSHFSVPNGGTTARTADPVEGMVRFNDDLNTLEFWNGFEWRQFTVTGASGRGVFGGGVETSSLINYINISSTGNSINFGTLFQSGSERSACSSSTRGLFNGGATPTHTNVIEYITLASEGNGIDFGDATINTLNRTAKGAASSSIRAVWAGGWGPGNENIIEYVEISTIGNALDFGDLSQPSHGIRGVSNGIRGVYGGGYKNPTSPSSTSKYEYITISSKGNAIIGDGDLINVPSRPMACSNSVRGLWGGGYNNPVGFTYKHIQYLTISSLGTAINFGDLTQNRTGGTGVSSQIRGVFIGGGNPTSVNTIDYVTISTTGNAQDFGDIATANRRQEGCSDSHGGLGGF